MTNSAINCFDCLKYKLRQASQPKVRFLQPSSPSPRSSCPFIAQLYPYIHQDKTQSNEQESVCYVVRACPSSNFSTASVAAFYPKSSTISLSHLFDFHLYVYEYEDHPFCFLLFMTFPFGSRKHSTYRNFRLYFAMFATSEYMLALVASSTYAQDFHSTLLASNRTSHHSALFDPSQILDKFYTGKSTVQIQQRCLYFQTFQSLQQKAHDPLVVVFGTNKLNRKRKTQSSDDYVSCGYAIDASCATFGFGSDPEALLLLRLSIEGLVVIINGNFLLAQQVKLSQGLSQSLINCRLQLRQIFNSKLLIEVTSDSCRTRAAAQVRANRFDSVTRGGNGKQNVKELIGRTKITVGFQTQVLGQSLPRKLEHITISQLWSIIFQGLASPLLICFLKLNHIEGCKLFLSKFQSTETR